MADAAPRDADAGPVVFDGRTVTVRRLPASARLALRIRETDARQVGEAGGFRLDQPVNRVIAAPAGLSARLGPDEWLLIAGSNDPSAMSAAVAASLGDIFHSLVDIGHRNAAFEISGPGAAAAINAGCPLDLDGAAFPAGMATRTILGRAEIVLMRPADAPSFRIECWRSFAGYVAGFLAEAAGATDVVASV